MRPLVIESGGLITPGNEAARDCLLNPACRHSQSPRAVRGRALVRRAKPRPPSPHRLRAAASSSRARGLTPSVDASALQCHRDFIVTPPGLSTITAIPAAPRVWMDVLDIPFVNMLDPGFAGLRGQRHQPVTKKKDSLARFRN